MSYDADLLNAYRDQLTKIRAAYAAFETALTTDPNYLADWNHMQAKTIDMALTLKEAIESTEADDIEHMYEYKGPAILLPDSDDPQKPPTESLGTNPQR